MKLKKKWKVVIALILVFIIILLTSIGIYSYQISCIDKNDKTDIAFTIRSGTSSKQIASNLEDSKLIHSKYFFMLYLKLNKINNLQASTYKLNRSMSVKEIVEVISKGKGYNPDEITLTFKEGKGVRYIAKVIDEATNNSYDDVINKTNDNNYIEKLKEKYWFIENDINKSGTFYKLEGYLFPNTYIFEGKDVTVEAIFDKMLNETNKILSNYKSEIESSSLSVRDIITMASIVELEGVNYTDRQNIASVFNNRMKKGISLGSDVTACYAQKIDDTALCHKNANFNYNSSYNTRLTSNLGLPTGPICNPSEESIKAVLNAPTTDYLYFVADKNTKTYFFKTKSEFDAKIKELKKNGDWL